MRTAGRLWLTAILIVGASLSTAHSRSNIFIEYAGSTLATGLGDVSVHGEYVYATMPLGLLVFQNHSDTALELVNALRILPGSWGIVKTVHNRAFLVSERDVLVLDITDPVNPIPGGSYPVPNGTDGLPALVTGFDVIPSCTCVAMSYLGRNVTGVLHISGADYQSPELLATYNVAPETYGISTNSSFAAVEGFSFPDATAAVFMNIADPRAPQGVGGFLGTPFQFVGSAHVYGSLAYVIRDHDGLNIVRIDSTWTPPVLGTYPDSSARKLDISGGRAYLFSYDSGVTAFELNDSINLTPLGSSIPSGFVAEIDKRMFYETTPAPQLKMVDWSVPTSPTLLDVYSDFPPPSLYVSIRDTMAFVSSDTLGLQVVNVRDATSPARVDSIRLAGAAGISVVVQGHLYVVKQDSTIDILNISDVGNVQVVNAFTPASLPRDFLLVGDILLMAVSDSGIQILSVSDPANPVFLNRIDLAGTTLSLALDGTLGCAVGTDPLLKVLDFSNLQTPQLIGQLPVNTSAQDVVVVDSVAYVAAQWQGLYVIDLHAPSTPSLIVHHTNMGLWPMLTVDRIDDYLVVIRRGEIHTMDISDPWNTHWTGVVPTPGSARQLVIEAPQIYVADGSSFTVLNVSGTVDISEPQAQLPSAFTLGSNFPNPFNAGTRISYVLSKAQSVDLTVFNLLGRPVSRLQSGDMAAGPYSVTWDGKLEDGREAPTGVYFYRLVANGHSETRKMLLLR